MKVLKQPLKVLWGKTWNQMLMIHHPGQAKVAPVALQVWLPQLIMIQLSSVIVLEPA